MLAYFIVEAVRQDEVFPSVQSPGQATELREIAERPEVPISPAAPLLDPEAADALADRLRALMREQRPYLRPALSLLDLAEALEVRPQILSYLLSFAFRQNFYAFVNAHRTAFAKTLLADPARDHLTVEGIGAEAGFRSKSAFYKAFKADTGTTPVAYKRSRRRQPDARDQEDDGELTFSLFGVGGNNWYNATFVEDDDVPGRTPATFDEEARSATGIVGLKHKLLLGQRAYVHTIVSGSYTRTNESADLLAPAGPTPNYGLRYREQAVRLSQLYNYKLNARHTLRAGAIVNFLDDEIAFSDTTEGTFRQRFAFAEGTTSFQAYASWKWRLTEAITANSGVHYFRYGYTGAQSLEPRLGLRAQLAPKHAVTLGAGLHSRAEGLVAYAAPLTPNNGETVRPNRGLGLGRAAHAVVGYELAASRHLRFKAEAYYQHLTDVPVSSDPNTGFSAINARGGDEFILREDTLLNEGTGRNYGLELTLERSLADGYYYLATASLYEAEYRLPGGDYLDNRFNGGYVGNVLGGRDFALGREGRNTLGVNARATFSGGLRYTPLDLVASRAAGESVESATPFSAQNAAYWRVDAGVNYRFNTDKATHTLSLTVQNAFNRLNEAERTERYDAARDAIVTRVFRQAGTVPILKYVVQF